MAAIGSTLPELDNFRSNCVDAPVRSEMIGMGGEKRLRLGNSPGKVTIVFKQFTLPRCNRTGA